MGKLKSIYAKNAQLFILIGILILLIIVMSLLSPSKFFTAKNFTSMGFQMAEFGIFAISMTVVILTGGINLSVTYAATLSAILGTLLMQSMTTNGAGVFVTILAGIAVMALSGVVLGAINGYFVSYVGVLAILVTLGTRSVYEGVGLNLTKGSAISGFPSEFQFFGNQSIGGVPIPLLIYILVIIAVILLIERTPFGVSVYMAGGNVRATEFSGINTKRTLMGVYILSGLLSGIAAIIMTSRYNSARTDYGSSYVMQSVAAAVLGGTDINGGAGSIIGTVVAVAVLQVISTGLNIFGANRNLVDIITGGILVGVLAINYFATREKKIKA